MLKRYPQLQSGFIARTDHGLIKASVMEDHVARPLLQRPPRHTQDDYFYSQAMDDLVDDFIQDPMCFNDLKKQEAVFQLVAVLFDRQGLRAFVHLQENANQLSQQHVDFLDETVGVLSGVVARRSISLPTWASLLSNANAPLNTPFSMAKMKHHQLLGQESLKNLDQTVVTWIRYLGWSDFMLSMQVIFGRRTIHAVRGKANL